MPAKTVKTPPTVAWTSEIRPSNAGAEESLSYGSNPPRRLATDAYVQLEKRTTYAWLIEVLGKPGVYVARSNSTAYGLTRCVQAAKRFYTEDDANMFILVFGLHSVQAVEYEFVADLWCKRVVVSQATQ